jgi:hypothetical protein
LALNDFVELLGTSEDLAIAISPLLITAGVAVGVGVGVADAIGVADAEGVGAAIIFPESQVRVVLPFTLTLIQVKSFPSWVAV